MTDSGQILIIAAITVMTVILTIIGVQLIFILKDIRKVLSRINKITDQIEKVGMNITHGSAEIIGFVAGVRKLFTVIEHISETTSSKKTHGDKSTAK